MQSKKIIFDWNDEKIRLFKDASEYTGFHRELAKIIRPYLEPQWTMCDMGCGLGLLDMQLSDSVGEITAIDIRKEAVENYAATVKKLGITNISVELKDALKVRDRKWDVLLFSFFGLSRKNHDDVARLFSMAGKRIIMIGYADKKSGKSADNNSSGIAPDINDTRDYFTLKGYPYKEIVKTMEFGQPVKSIADAYKYFGEYSREKDPVKRKERIENDVKSLVLPTHDKTFPYFIPKKKNMGILVADVR